MVDQHHDSSYLFRLDQGRTASNREMILSGPSHEVYITTPNDFQDMMSTMNLNEDVLNQYQIPYQELAQLLKPETGSLSTTTVESPKILLDDRATFCTLLLLFDQGGNAALLHEALAYGVMSGGLSDVPSVMSFEEFGQTLGEKNLIITGTNVSTRFRRKITSELMRVLSPSKIEVIDTIFTDDQQLSDILELNDDSPADMIRGVVFFPRQMTTDDKNKVVLIGHSIADYGIYY
jgi:hypothetical protein